MNALSDLRFCIDMLGLTSRALADALHTDDRDLRRIIAGHVEMQPELAGWASRLATFLRANPPPRLPRPEF